GAESSRRHTADRFAGHLVLWQPPRAPEGAGDPVLVLQTEDAAFHAASPVLLVRGAADPVRGACRITLRQWRRRLRGSVPRPSRRPRRPLRASGPGGPPECDGTCGAAANAPAPPPPGWRPAVRAVHRSRVPDRAPRPAAPRSGTCS